MAYSAYNPRQSHSNALRPILPPLPYQQESGYEPLHIELASPRSEIHPSPPFARDRDYSQDSINGHFYGAGGGGGHVSDEAREREYGDEIPLRERHTAQQYDETAVPRKDEPYTTESAMTAEEASREQRRKDYQKRRQKAKGLFGGKITWVCYTMTLIQITVFIAELVKASILTGSPIEIHPSFNPMIGPSPYVLINMGARYLPCMKDETADGVTGATFFPCPNTTTADPTSATNQCHISDLCGLSASSGQYPLNQWYRFITPIFIHAGIVHIGFNMLLQWTLGREMEEIIGSVRFFFVYMTSGIFGFVLGGNFAAKGIASMGASGALFGITAIGLLDLLYTWGTRKNPGKELAMIGLEIVVSLVLGLLPGLDNFSHIGGLLMGLVLGVCILRSPDPLRKRIRPKSMMMSSSSSSMPSNPSSPTDQQPRAQVADVAALKVFTKGPLAFFQGRKGWWWAWWMVRVGALLAILICFVVLLKNFYLYQDQCSWCKYLSCLPITTGGTNWCDIGSVLTQQTQPTTETGGSQVRRMVGIFGLGM